jgi:NAD(P)-dependent dehydrogenase (short-subunit alcohol dehydrogenase family)
MSKTVAIITGGAHGIGEATSRMLAKCLSHHIVIGDIDLPKAQSLAAELSAEGAAAEACFLDVADSKSWSDLKQKLDSEGLRVAVIVNNAYRIERAPLHEQDDQIWNHQFEVLLGGVRRSIATFHDHLSFGGSVVNVSSVHAVQGWANHSAYAAAKGAVLSLTRQLAVEYGPDLRVNSVVPGAIETRAWAGLINDAGRAELYAQIPSQRFGAAEEVASAIEFLASDRASYITGASLVVDGGLTIKG